MTVKVKQGRVRGELSCGVGGAVLIATGPFSYRPVAASAVEVIPGSPDAAMEAEILAAALRCEQKRGERLHHRGEGAPRAGRPATLTAGAGQAR